MHISAYTKTMISRNAIELLITIMTAGVVVLWFNASPLLMVGAMGMSIVIPILLRKPEYGCLFLTAILPFRDVHLVSIIHFKRFVIWGLLLYLLIQHMTTPQKSVSRNFSRFMKIAFLFVIVLIISVMRTVAARHTSVYLTNDVIMTIVFSNALVIVEQILIGYILYYSVGTLPQIQRLLDLMLMVSAVIAVLGILQYLFEGTPSSVSFLFDQEIQFYGRATSVFSNPNSLGIFLAPIVSIALIMLIWSKRSRFIRFGFVLPCLLVDSLAMFLSFSRTAVIQVLFSFFVINYLDYVKICRKKFSWKMAIMVLLNVVLIVTVPQFYGRFAQLRVRAFSKDPSWALERIKATSDEMRKYAARTAFKTFLEHPVFGVGYDIVGRTMIGSVQWVENQFLKILAEMGIFGFIAFLLLNILIIQTGLKIWDQRQYKPFPYEEQIILLILLSGISTAMVAYFFVDFLHAMAVTGYHWVLVGAMFAIDNHYAPPK